MELWDILDSCVCLNFLQYIYIPIATKATNTTDPTEIPIIAAVDNGQHFNKHYFKLKHSLSLKQDSVHLYIYKYQI